MYFEKMSQDLHVAQTLDTSFIADFTFVYTYVHKGISCAGDYGI